MTRPIATLCALLALFIASPSQAEQEWQAGKHYFLVSPAQRTSVPAGKVEVTEVFSYGCPFCYQIEPVVKKLRASLPANAQIVYLPASYIPHEAWPMFQRAYFTAQALGISERTHQAMFEAVWKTGELAISDPNTRRLKNPLPTIEDAARFYARVAGVKPEAFLAAASSFGVDARMRAADALIGASEAMSTPTFLVNGKYRLNASSAGGYDQLVEAIQYLVARESAPAKGADRTGK